MVDLHKNQVSFMFQARTGQVMKDSTPVGATIFTAFAGLDSSGSNFQIELASSKKSKSNSLLGKSLHIE